MANEIVFNLEFEQIKDNLRTFLQEQTNVTQDGITTNVYNSYDFDGSSINAILNLLAYSAHYTALQANLVASEAYLDSASLRGSIVSKIKPLAYLPSQRVGAVSTINVKFPVASTSGLSRLIVPEGTTFSSTHKGKTLLFYTIEAGVLLEDSDEQFSGDLVIREGLFSNGGILPEHQFIFEGIDAVDDRGIRQRFILSNTNLDINSLKVKVGDEFWVNGMSEPNLISQNSDLFFLQETEDGAVEIFFGDNIIGKSPDVNDLISVSYSSTEGPGGNGFSEFILISDIESLPQINFDVTSVVDAEGGARKETDDSIKLNGPAYFQTQGRAVVASDYEALIKKIHPDIKSISAFGGEDTVPQKPGKVFVSIQTLSGFPLSPTAKTTIVDKINRLNVGKVNTEIVDNNYIDINITSNVLVDSAKTNLTNNSITESVVGKIEAYFDTVVGLHNSDLVVSKLGTEIDSINTAIVGNSTTFKISQDLILSDQKLGNYVINLNNEIVPGSFKIDLNPPTTTFLTYNGVVEASTKMNDDGTFVLVGRNVINYPEIDGVEYGYIDYKTGIVNLVDFKPSKNIGTSIKVTAETDQTRIKAKLNTIFRVGTLDISIDRQ